MSLPYVLGVQMFRSFPDFPPGVKGTSASVGWATDSLTQDYIPKQVYYAMLDLIASWKTSGSEMTNSNGEVSFDGLGGTYSIGVTTPNGLFQSFVSEINQTNKGITLTIDSPQAILNLQQRLAEAQKGVDWSAQLGRMLDYDQLRSQLTTARSAIMENDFASARSLVNPILDITAINIDGSAEDWQGIPPVLTAPQGGVQVNAAGVDLKALYGMMDDQYLYLLVEVYDPPITPQPGEDNGGIRYPGFSFTLHMGSGEEYGFGVNIPYRGQIDLFRVTDPFHFIGTYYSIAYHNALELKLPLDLLGNPSQVSACGFVTAHENGEGKVAKAFDGCAWVLHPVTTFFMPLIKR